MAVDPVSGNEIPPGGTAKGVRDDVPIMASENEFMIPENVTKYYGTKFFQDLIEKANVALADEKGKSEEEPELPFDPDQLQGTEDKPPVAGFAKGGQITTHSGIGEGKDFSGIKKYKNPDGRVMYVPFLYGEPTINVPDGYSEFDDSKVTDKAPDPISSVDSGQAGQNWNGNDAGHDPAKGEAQQASPLAGDPKNWSYNDFMNFEKSKGSVGERAVKGMIGMIPGGRIAMMARSKYLDRATADLVDGMLDSKTDPQGNPLSQEQLLHLSTTREEMKTQMSDQSKLNLNPIERLGDAFQKFSDFIGGRAPTPAAPSGGGGGNVGAPAAGTNALNQTYSGNSGSGNGTNASTGGSYSVGSDMGRDPSQGPSSGQMASGGLYAKGGLITRRGCK